MPLPDTSNEQKLTYIYQTLKAQEARRKRHIFMKVLKWILYVSVIFFAYTYREPIMDTLYKYTRDAITKEIRRINEEQKAGILRGVQQLLPEIEKFTKSIESSSQTGTIKTATGKTTPTATKTGTTTVKKK